MTTPNPKLLIVLGSIVLLYAACGEGQPAQLTQVQANPPPSRPALVLATPHFTQVEEPLAGLIPDIPDVYVVPYRQSQQALAQTLKTTVDQLTWTNPGLPNPVGPQTLVVIPTVYRTSQGERLSDISAKTGMPETLLRAANPKINATTALSETTLVALPRLFIAPNDTLLEAAADALGTDAEALLSANPTLAGQSEIGSGIPLVVPFGQIDEDQP